MNSPFSGLDSIVQIFHGMFAVVLQVCVRPLDMGSRAELRMSEENFVDCVGASELARESELDTLWVESLRSKRSKHASV